LPYGKVAAAVAAWEGGNAVYEKASAWWKNRYEYNISISDDEAVYPEVHDWLIKATPSKEHRKLSLTTRNSFGRVSSGDSVPDSPGEGDVPRVRLIYNSNRRKTVYLDGCRVEVFVNSEASEFESKKILSKTIEFSARSLEGQQAVIRLVEKLVANRAERKPRLRLVNNWGSWNTRNDLPPRSLASVILPTEQKDRVISDVRQFLEAEQKYVDLAIPWHRGYMFHGPPGGGKTSLARALSTEFGLDMWYVSLGDLKAESNLLALLSEVSPRSILLLEDIDTVKIAQDRDAAEQGTISTSSLLNALDGVATPHGLITVMTTNHFEKLDPALTRRGRMDVVEEILPPTVREIEALYTRFYGTEFNSWMKSKLPSGPLPISQASVSEIFKRHLNNPRAASTELSEKLEAIAYD
jgi:hypothetical protein